MDDDKKERNGGHRVIAVARMMAGCGCAKVRISEPCVTISKSCTLFVDKVERDGAHCDTAEARVLLGGGSAEVRLGKSCVTKRTTWCSVQDEV